MDTRTPQKRCDSKKVDDAARSASERTTPSTTVRSVSPSLPWAFWLTPPSQPEPAWFLREHAEAEAATIFQRA